MKIKLTELQVAILREAFGYCEYEWEQRLGIPIEVGDWWYAEDIVRDMYTISRAFASHCQTTKAEELALEDLELHIEERRKN